MKEPRRSASNAEMMEEEGPGWLVTYADLMTLLLCLFVLLFAMSTISEQRYRMIAAELKKSFGNPTAVIELVAPDVDKAPEDLSKKEPEGDLAKVVPPEVMDRLREEVYQEVLENLDQDLLDDVNRFAEEQRVGENIVVTTGGNKITITIEGQVLFDSGSAVLRPEALPILDEIGRIIRNYPDYRVNIKGYTDNRPISTLQFPSNWELSAVRATTVLRRLVDQGVAPDRLTGTGYGELMPLAPNDSDENRAKNRRVEFVLEKEKKAR